MATNLQSAPDRRNEKSAQAFRTISEVATELDVPQHVLRFWESKFNQVRPLKRGGGRRYYRPEDVDLLRKIRGLLYEEGYTIKGVQRLLRENRGRLGGAEPPYSEAIRADMVRNPESAPAPRAVAPAAAAPQPDPAQPRPQLVRPAPAAVETPRPEAVAGGARPSTLDPARRRELEAVMSDLQSALKLLRGE
ncbi:MAG: MerR family transcriptional regulator [Reyranellaceae bacterium]